MLTLTSQHADYIFGWKGDSLKVGMEAGCAGADCPGMATQTMEPAEACQVPAVAGDTYDGCECCSSFFSFSFASLSDFLCYLLPAGGEKPPQN